MAGLAQRDEQARAEEFEHALNRLAAQGRGTSGAAGRAAPAPPRTPAPGPAGAAAAEPSASSLALLAHRVGTTGAALPHLSDTRSAEIRALVVRMTGELYGGAAAPAPARTARGGRHAIRHLGDPHAEPAADPTTRRRPTRSRSGPSPWRRRILAMGVGMAVATSSVGGIAIASSDALPGDPLYSAKKLFENVQLSLAGSPTDRGEEYLQIAEIRISEIDGLLARGAAQPGSPDQAYLAGELTALQQAVQDGGALLVQQVQDDGDPGALSSLSLFLQAYRQSVADLEWRLPPALQGQAAKTVALMDGLGRELLAAENTYRRHQVEQQQQSGSAATAEPGGQTGAEGSPAGGSSPHGDAGTTAAGPSAGPSGSASPHASPSASPSPTVGLNLPLPILPTTTVVVPPLLGLPEITLNLGGGGATPSNSPSGDD